MCSTVGGNLCAAAAPPSTTLTSIGTSAARSASAGARPRSINARGEYPRNTARSSANVSSTCRCASAASRPAGPPSSAASASPRLIDSATSRCCTRSWSSASSSSRSEPSAASSPVRLSSRRAASSRHGSASNPRSLLAIHDSNAAHPPTAQSRRTTPTAPASARPQAPEPVSTVHVPRSKWSERTTSGAARSRHTTAPPRIASTTAAPPETAVPRMYTTCRTVGTRASATDARTSASARAATAGSISRSRVQCARSIGSHNAVRSRRVIPRRRTGPMPITVTHARTPATTRHATVRHGHGLRRYLGPERSAADALPVTAALRSSCADGPPTPPECRRRREGRQRTSGA